MSHGRMHPSMKKRLDRDNERTEASDRGSSASTTASVQGWHHDVLEDSDSLEIEAPAMTPLPAYEEFPRRLSFTQDGTHTEARVTGDGRVDIELDIASRRLSLLLKPSLTQLRLPTEPTPPPSPQITAVKEADLPSLNIVMQLVGSRGDIQPFLGIGLELQKAGHRVRIATHPTFKNFVESTGLEFFSIGGDPVELMAYMVRNPGLIPDLDSVMRGDVRRQRKGIRAIVRGCWRSCIEAGDGIIQDASSSGCGPRKNLKPFVADAIIANPPSFAHIHCAEKLGIPLHLVFTMPWSPTKEFAHPLANIKSSNADTGLTNYMSYVLVEMMTWQGIGGVVNSFRRENLGLELIDSTWAPGMITRLRIPYTYCWSPALMPKPKDWGRHINVTGFSFLSTSSTYRPPQKLLDFIHAGKPPVYIGFGSIVVDDPQALTTTILEAIEIAKVRAVVARGWCDLGGGARSLPANVFMLDSCPHDWLFPQVSCVVHHGGAGTTAAGLAAGKPTVIVPFFGDQPFWGEMVFRMGAGPQPIPIKELSASRLATAIVSATTSATTSASALGLATCIAAEDGARAAVDSFHAQLPQSAVTCSLLPQKAAVWIHRKHNLKLSALAATILQREGLIKAKHLEQFRSCEYDLDHGPWDPISGGILATTAICYNVFKGLGEIGTDIVRLSKTVESASRKPSASQKSSAQRQTGVLTYSSTAAASSSTTSNSSLPTLPKPKTSPSGASSLDERDKLGSQSLKGTNRIFKAAIRAPVNVTMALSQGAHNAPRLWGDTTVRPQDKVTGLGSGLVAAGKEFTLQTYDGIAGLITQPFLGARMGSGGGGGGGGAILGAISGVGKGVVGLPVKWLAGASATVGYPLKGLDMEISKLVYRGVMAEVVEARLRMGEWEWEWELEGEFEAESEAKGHAGRAGKETRKEEVRRKVVEGWWRALSY